MRQKNSRRSIHFFLKKERCAAYEENENLYIKKLGSANQSPDLLEKNEYIAKIMEEKERMNTRMSELERVKREIGREYEDMRYKYMKLGNQNSK